MGLRLFELGDVSAVLRTRKAQTAATFEIEATINILISRAAGGLLQQPGNDVDAQGQNYRVEDEGHNSMDESEESDSA